MSTPDSLETIKETLGDISKVAVNTSYRLEDVLALQQLPKLPNSIYVPWTVSAIKPSSLLVVLNDILIHGRKKIVECGAGLSTLYIASILEQADAQLFTIENDPNWIAIVKTQIKRAGVPLDRVTFIEAPMDKSEMTPKGKFWYSQTVLEEQAPASGVDLLLVDGPIGGVESMEHARYPALPFFMNRMAESFTVFLDDCHREGEVEIANDWVSRFELEGAVLKTRGDIGYFYKKGQKTFNIV